MHNHSFFFTLQSDVKRTKRKHVIKTINSVMFHKFLEKCAKKTTPLSSSQAGQRILYNNTPTINTWANCQQLITSDLCQDGADEIILPSFYIWPCSALTSSLMLTGQLMEAAGSFKPRASFCMNERPFFPPVIHGSLWPPVSRYLKMKMTKSKARRSSLD